MYIYIYFQSGIVAREISCIERQLPAKRQILSRIRRICTTAFITPGGMGCSRLIEGQKVGNIVGLVDLSLVVTAFHICL